MTAPASSAAASERDIKAPDLWQMGACLRRHVGKKQEVFRTAIPRDEEFKAGKYTTLALIPVPGGDVVEDTDPFYALFNALTHLDGQYKRLSVDVMSDLRELGGVPCPYSDETHLVRAGGVTFSACRVAMLSRYIAGEFGAVLSVLSVGTVLVLLGGKGYGILAPRAAHEPCAPELWRHR